MKRYVAGLLFNDKGNEVALIHKIRGPQNVIGKWNAIGGKCEIEEISHAAMRREFIEETGVDVPCWTLFMQLKGNGWEVDFFHAFDSKALSKVETKTDEEVDFFDIDELPIVVPNIKWIIPMALGHYDDNVNFYKVRETT